MHRQNPVRNQIKQFLVNPLAHIKNLPSPYQKQNILVALNRAGRGKILKYRTYKPIDYVVVRSDTKILCYY